MIPHPINQLRHEELRREALVAWVSHEAQADRFTTSRAERRTRFPARGSARRVIEAAWARFPFPRRVPVPRWSARLFL